MANLIIIDDNWNEEIMKLAERFNNFAKKGSMRMTSFLVDKAFEIAANDDDANRYDAARFLQRVRALNPKLISSYVSTLIDSRANSFYFENDEYVTPSYFRQSRRNKEEQDDDVIVIEDEEKRQDQAHGAESSEQAEKDDVNSEAGLLSWKMEDLIKYQLVQGLEKSDFDSIKSPIKKCACGDGLLDRESDIWICSECGTSYHENCAKIVAILEGACRICDAKFVNEEFEIDYSEDSSEEEKG